MHGVGNTPNLGGIIPSSLLTLDNFIIAVNNPAGGVVAAGLGGTTGATYVTSVADSDNHDPSNNLGLCYEFFDDQTRDFRVDLRFDTVRNTQYDISVGAAFSTSSTNDRVTFGIYHSGGGGLSSVAQSGSKTPFGTSYVNVIRFTTPNASTGDATRLRINQHSTASTTRTWYKVLSVDPV